MSFALFTKPPRRFLASTFPAAFVVGLLLVAGHLPGSAAREFAPTRLQQTPRVVFGAPYKQTNLVSDLPGVALVEDRRLVNPWGIAIGSARPFWINNNKGDLATLYRGDVAGSPLAPNPSPSSVAILNTPTLVATPATPTAVVANTSSDFQVALPPFGPQPAEFIVATELGGINAWHSNFGIAAPAVVVRFVSGHRYTGLTIASNASGNLLFAADFANGQIDVFDKNFADTSVSGNFTDATVPANFHPYNIQNLNGSLYVTYAEFSHVNNDFGFVRKFNSDGVRDPAFAINNGLLADPWGLAIAPANFGAFSNRLLVGNYRTLGLHAPSINAFSPVSGAPAGGLTDENGDAIEIKKLRGLTFGNGVNGGDQNTLYFVSSFPNEQFQQPHGLFGSLKAAVGTPACMIQFSAPEYFTSEAAHHFDVTVTRTGDLSGVATVNYATVDSYASQRTDYEIALGRLTFNPGEASKTFRVLIVDDNNIAGGTYYELQLVLSNATGGALATPNIARLLIGDNEGDTQGQPENIIDDAQFFVRQQYFDFLNREPDQAGLDFWTNQITSCGTDQDCIETKRINVSAAFFLSIEFQRTGMLAHLTEKAAFGGLPRYGQFMRDVQALQKDYVFGAPDAAAQLEVNKQAFFNEFVRRPEFAAKYNSLSNGNYVKALFLNAGLNTTTAEVYIAQLDSAQQVPPNSSTAKGLVIFRQGRIHPRLFVTLYLNGLSSVQTEAHLHGPATAGSTGPLQVVLPTGQLVEYETTLTNPQFLDLSGGRIYVDVHTLNFPNGEIRGQMPANRFVPDMLANSLDAGIITRAQALRLTVESDYFDGEMNRAFVLMEYFGYLRRNPDDFPDTSLSGYNFWLNKLNQFNGNFINADMVKAFLRSTEYRRRFGP